MTTTDRINTCRQTVGLPPMRQSRAPVILDADEAEAHERFCDDCHNAMLNDRIPEAMKALAAAREIVSEAMKETVK